MSFSRTDFNRDLLEAVESFHRDRAAELCGELVRHLRKRDDPYPLDDAKVVLKQLRRRRCFDLMQAVSDALIFNDQEAPEVRRQYAQSQVDQGNLTAAISILQKLAADTAPEGEHSDSEEYCEARGLLGRAYGDLYLLAGAPKQSRNRRFLQRAIDYYRGIYENDKERVWQGVNSVALIRRAAADAVELDHIEGLKTMATAMATEILAEVEKRYLEQRADTWDCATGLEACIGLGDTEAAAQWLNRYLASQYTDAFELGSTYRQLTQVWQLNQTEAPGNFVLPALTEALLKRQGSEVEVRIEKDLGYEKVFGTDSFQSFKWFRKLLQRAAAVARVEDSNGNDVGTAFVVRGGDFVPKFGDELLFLTNAHVVSQDPNVSRALRPERAGLSFEIMQEVNSQEFAVEELWSSPPHLLDATLLRPKRPIEGIEPMPLSETLPLRDGSQRAYIIGHPSGRRLSFSIHDNYLLDYDDRLLHYRSPTEPGSSGSPVFNGDLDLIGLHHRGTHKMPKLNGQDGTYAANEGIRIQAIRKGLAGADIS